MVNKVISHSFYCFGKEAFNLDIGDEDIKFKRTASSAYKYSFAQYPSRYGGKKTISFSTNF